MSGEIITPGAASTAHVPPLAPVVPSSSAATRKAIADDSAHENQLVQVRLGIAASLFTALKGKHAPTAAHSLRVALGCSSWAMATGMSGEKLDEIEIAALLHDVGKIGVPDSALMKPGALTAAESVQMDRHRRVGVEILRRCCAAPGILEIVYYAPAWYDGKRTNFRLHGNDLPLGARMLAIVDAFDSMCTDTVYRRAMSQERALAELYEHAGTQFDPELVKNFARLHESDLAPLHQLLARRWLEDLGREPGSGCWGQGATPSSLTEPAPESLFQQKLLDNMRDGVVFVDDNLQIHLWNRGAERLTGLPGTSVFQRHWSPTLVGMCDEKGRPVADEDCPVNFVLRNGVQSIRRLLITNRSGRQVSCDVHIVPVIGQDGITQGADVLLHDASPEASLEERCQSLHEKATRDPLTQVANRSEFDLAHKEFVETHRERGLPCSLIMCDIDHFKKVNDTYGHPAGDEAIKTFAQLLKQSCRPGDLVARYGGEEFVVLCADCDNATAAQRAEQIRRALADLPLPTLSGNRITASFGVTEVQPGDSDETMLRRADRALLMAKDAGRNAVVQLGSGIGEQRERFARTGWFSWLPQRRKPDVLLEENLITPVPLKVAIEKLRGFVADHFGYVDGIDGNHVLLRIETTGVPLLRRTADRPLAFLLELTLQEERLRVEVGTGSRTASKLRTKLLVVIRPKRQRDRRRTEALHQARQLLSSLRSYLMASDIDLEPEDDNVLRRASNVLSSWIKG